jgi:protein SCO1
MKNKTKALILSSVLIVPPLAYIFLYNSGQNHYKLPKFVPQIDSVTGQPVVKKRVNPRPNESDLDTVFRTIPAFQLTDQNGQPFGSAQTRGKIYVADFFFTRCGTICPKITKQLVRVQETFTDDKDLLILSHSVDPQTDTPEVMAAYARKYQARPGKWFFLTGTKKDIYPLAVGGYFVPVTDASEYDKAIKNPDEAFIHSEKLILIDKEGFIRGFYDGTDPEEVDRLILEIKILQKIYTQQ